MVAYINKPKLKPVNASRVQNQSAKDNQSQMANEALSYSPSTKAFLRFCFFSAKVSPTTTLPLNGKDFKKSQSKEVMVKILGDGEKLKGLDRSGPLLPMEEEASYC